MSHPQGWIDDPAAVSEVCQRFAATGHPVTFSAGRPQLVGYWATLVQRGIYAVLPYLSEKAVAGEFAQADTQNRGTCVSHGVSRAIRDSTFYDIHQGGEIANPAFIAYEPIYGGARVQIRKGGLGNSDGAIVADAALFVHDYGTVVRGTYGGIDISDPREDLAVSWGAPGRGVPQAIIDAGKAHRCRVYQCNGPDRAADCLSAGYCVAIGTNRIHSEHRDQNGMCHYGSAGGHCTELCGVFVLPTWNGDYSTLYQHTGFVDQQSWGEYPTGNPTLHYYGSNTAPLRQGAFGLDNSEVRAMFAASGDAWAVKLEQQYR